MCGNATRWSPSHLAKHFAELARIWVMSPASSTSTESSASTTVTATGEKRRRRKLSEAKKQRTCRSKGGGGKAVLLPIKSVDGKATYFRTASYK